VLPISTHAVGQLTGDIHDQSLARQLINGAEAD
jgi:hypothetical protein